MTDNTATEPGETMDADPKPYWATVTETQKAKAAYNDFIAFGGARSIKGLHEHYVKLKAEGKKVPTTSLHRLYVWSTSFKWFIRAKHYEDQRQAATLEAETNRWVQVRADHRTDMVTVGDALIKRAMDMLKWPLAVTEYENTDANGVRHYTVKPARWNMSDIPRFVDVADKLKRLAANMDTERTHIEIEGVKGIADDFGLTEDTVLKMVEALRSGGDIRTLVERAASGEEL